MYYMLGISDGCLGDVIIIFKNSVVVADRYVTHEYSIRANIYLRLATE